MSKYNPADKIVDEYARDAVALAMSWRANDE